MSEGWLLRLREIIVDSLNKTWLPLPIDERICENWKVGLQQDTSSSTVFYTSCMYHLAPVIEKAVESLERFGASGGGLMSALAGFAARTFGRQLLKPDQAEVDRADRVVRSMHSLLARSGLKFRLLDKEIYSGALLYELGFERDFVNYARKVVDYFKQRGIREIVTVDPHTHYLLEKVYPKYFPDFDIKVASYMDFIEPRGVSIKNFAIHDSCLYARYLDRYQTVRKLLKAGEPVEDPFVTGRDTSQCCGGPIESTFPNIAKQIAKARVKELARLSRKVVVQCPICYVNLKRASEGEVELYHMAEVLL
ncbi:MAG: heterodisulfide reductase-related iron-sulfur binding cluster [Thermoproteus sp.]